MAGINWISNVRSREPVFMNHFARIPRIIAVTLCIASTAAPAYALKFDRIQTGPGRFVLFVRDCGLGHLPEDYDSQDHRICASYETHFAGAGRYKDKSSGSERNYPGDAAVLRDLLRSGSYDEVWLFSDGGDLDQGLEVGRVLREQQMAVRVPNIIRVRQAISWPQPTEEVSCVSSCTVAFMGGVLRNIDNDATYQVHSASAVLDLSDEALEFYHELLKQDNGFAQFAAKRQNGARLLATHLLRHFQNTLVIPLGVQLPRAEDDRTLVEFVVNGRNSYSQSQLEIDRRRYQSEGDAAAQDILMRIEREAMESAIADLEPLVPGLGPRAKFALDMVKVMYKVGIKESFTLTRETMLKMGYITQDIDLGARANTAPR